jgi:hypothetical protein
MAVLIDEKGEHHDTCHGVSASEWFRFVTEARGLLLRNPEQIGMAKLEDPRDLRCEDPDCQRLHRMRADGPAAHAQYELTKDLVSVRPTDLENEKERKICEGHPWKYGTYLCQPCAVVATAKRLINDQTARHI